MTVDTNDKVEEEQLEETPEEEVKAEAKAGDGDGRRRGGGLTILGEGRPSRSRLLQLVVLLALAASIVSAVLQWRHAEALTTTDSTEQQVRTRAGEFGQALLSYEHTNLKAARSRVMSLSTGDFSKFYDVSFTGALEGLILKLKATAKATVRDVYTTEVDGSRAKAVVVMDSEVQSTSGTRRVLGSYLDLELVKQKGVWKVNTVASVGAINESVTKPDGTPVTPQASGDPGTPKP